MNLLKVNECRHSGNIAHVDIRNGAHGPYGSIGVIIDDGYFKKVTTTSPVSGLTVHTSLNTKWAVQHSKILTH